MIKVTISNNVKRVDTDPISASTTIREVLEEYGFDTSVGTYHLNGSALTSAELNKSFSELGTSADCFITNVVKADNA